MTAMMKWPLLAAAAIVVLRVALERAGAPEVVNNVFGVAWLYFLVPVYFAMQLLKSGNPKPYGALVKNTAIYAALTRLMVIPTYWLAYANQWTQARFSAEQGGVVGDGITPLQGYLIIPVRNALFWVVFATILGGLIGGVYLAIRLRKTAKSAA